ncbi:hypothetical protein D3C73_1247210 [compost metagenome]
MSHSDLIRADNSQTINSLLVIRILLMQHAAEASVDLFNDHIDPWKQISDHSRRPLFKSLTKDRMVRVRDSPDCNIPGLFPAVAFDIHKYTHEFGDDQGRVRIIDMQRYLFRQMVIGQPQLLKGSQDALQTCRAEEILLLQAEQLPFILGIIRVQELRDRLHRAIIIQKIIIVIMPGCHSFAAAQHSGFRTP